MTYKKPRFSWFGEFVLSVIFFAVVFVGIPIVLFFILMEAIR